MHLRADEQKARNVRAVLLDGKAVPMCYEADEEEGWVKSYIVELPDTPAINGEEMVEDDDGVRAGYKLIKRTGRVSIVFHKSDTSMGDPEG